MTIVTIFLKIKIIIKKEFKLGYIISAKKQISDFNIKFT
jgi:hypothetical protein